MVLSIVLLIVGAIAYTTLPVAEYPQVVPPTVVVTTQYPGASAQTVSDTVAAPIEQQINGVEDMLYLYSQATSNGQLTITVTFKLGTDLDKAQVLVQNRVAIALPQLPDEVQRNGVVTQKKSPDILMVVFMLSPDDSFDQLYISNYALLQVRDQLLRLDGIGDITIFGARDYSMRLWLDPDKIANLGMTAGDVVAAIRAQNLQITGGQLAAPPIADRAFQPNLTFTGRLKDVAQFEDIVVKAGADGRTVRLRDVARIELGALDYTTNSFLLRKTAVAMLVTQRPGSNALATAKNISNAMVRLKADFPKGLDYNIGYNPTEFIAQSVHELIKTIYEAMLLVVIVVLVFLQGWRPAIIPIVAIPVSLVGTFSVMAALGFAVNNLTLFGLVLAVGIVVDDAIVVVENVERHLRDGMSRRDAALRTMEEVGGALVSIALVLCGGVRADRVPRRHLRTVFPAIRRHHRGGDGDLPVLLADAFARAGVADPAAARREAAAGELEFYRTRLGQVHRALQPRLRPPVPRLRRRRRLRDPAFGADVVGLPRADRQRRMAARYHAARLYSGAGSRLRHRFRATAGRGLAGAHHRDRSQDREHRARYAGHHPGGGIRGTVGRDPHPVQQCRGIVSGVRRTGGAPEKGPDRGTKISADLQRRLSAIEGAFIIVIPPPSIPGIGTGGGFTMRIEDRSGRGPELLAAATDELVAAARKAPGLTQVFSPFSANTPQVFVDIDRVKAQKLGVPIANVTEAIETYFGSTYVNDFNILGRTYHVTAQADLPFRKETADLARLRTRNASGDMVQLGSVVDFRDISGPDRVARYNLYPAAELQGATTPGTSSQTAIDIMKKLAAETLPSGFSYEWTDLSYQQVTGANAGLLGVSDLRAVRVPGAGRAIWQLEPAVCRHPDRADVPAGRDPRRADHGAGCQYPDPDRLRRPRRPCRQERHPDRRICPRHRTRG